MLKVAMLWPVTVETPEGSNKLVHLTAFATLAFPLACTGRFGLIPIFIGSSAFGAAIDLIQSTFNRSANIGDWVADTIGVAVGISEDLLVRMIEAQPDNLVGKRNKLLLSLWYGFLARRSELVAIQTEDLTFTPDGALKGIIRRSKTEQYGRGRLVFGSERSAKLVRKWLRQKPKEIQAVFCAVNRGRCIDRPICDRQFNEIIKQGLIRVKRYTRPSDFEVSGHSLRVGAAQD